jgi:DNA polymerase II large subunit
MTINKAKKSECEIVNIDVERELVDDFEKVNFGAKRLEILEQELSHAHDEVKLDDEERKTKILSAKKNVDTKLQVSLEKTAKKQNEKVRTTLPHNTPFPHGPTIRHK